MNLRNLLFCILFPLCASAQIDSFHVEIEPFSIADMPASHSGAIATYNGRWIILGGRINGLHGFQSPFAFPNNGKNESVWIVDPISGQKWSASLTGLPVNLYEPLTSSNIPFYQDDNRLYMVGGYGWSDVAGDFRTFPTLTAIDLPCLHDAVVNGTSVETCFRQITDSVLAISGSHLKKLNDRYYLIFGHRFDGIYAVNNGNNAFYHQTYSNEVRSFQIQDDGVNLAITDYTALRDTVNFHRRDYNLVPQIFSDGEAGFTAFSGVFQYSVNLPYLNTIDVRESSATVVPNFDQHLSQYHSAVMPVYDSTGNVMHSYFFGGMSRFTIDSLTQELVDDTLVPFVKTISRISRFADGSMVEEQLPISFPEFLGSNMEFVPAPGVPLKQDAILNVNKMQEDRQLAGYLVGGIWSPMANISSIDPSMSSANAQVYAVYIVRSSNDTGIVTQTLEANLPLAAFSCAPNPAIGSTQINLKLHQAGQVQLAAYTRKGELVEIISNQFMQAGEHKINWSVSSLSSGTYILRARMNGVTKTVSIIINP
ncbi:MAG TPA: T9SS type A sorting domain-containing protein [Flavobacteriales bacterium]|nr:T9SS type A sorting domain-containing protein [Flavobacteriales bacterium]HPH82455.1 T9SS type A sorting domain-containing protein [Flavobacteriales bacterium]